jgi:hypothetical protein
VIAQETITHKALLRTEVEGQIREIGRADILVGIPSFNNAGAIEHVVRAIKAGFAKYFPDCQAVLVNSDGGSTDGTPEAVRRAAIVMTAIAVIGLTYRAGKKYFLFAWESVGIMAVYALATLILYLLR